MLQAYLDNLAVAPGGQLRIHANGVEHCDAEVTRLLHSDPNPAGPGVMTEECHWGMASFPCSDQPATVGSFGVASSWLPPTSSITMCGWFMPTNLRRETVLFSWHSDDQDVRISIVDGNLCARSGTDVATLRTPHYERQWHFLGVCLERDDADGSVDVSLFSAPWGRTGGPYMSPPVKVACYPAATSPLYVGADLRAGKPNGQLDGLLTAIQVHDSTLDIVDLMLTMNGDGPEASVSWTFDTADVTDPDLIASASQIASDLVLHHAPTRSADVPGPCSDGRPTCQASRSVHFHTDDVEDCGWPCVAEITVPPETTAGFYAIGLTGSNGDRFELPFIVETAASVTLLVPTLTWQAYANLGRSRTEWPGLSHYALHDDGSPVIMTTAHKPSQTFASSARLEVDSGDGFAAGPVLAHLLMADLYADYWLGLRGAHGLLDDRAIHDPARRALDDVRVLILSTHHEYWTHTMLDEFERFLARGGSAIYLGGNGLYWVTSLHAKKPHLMEIRRWGGSQTCSVSEIDRHHQFEDTRGGLWRDNGRGPSSMVGVEFAGFGAGDSLSYERTPESYDAEWSWVFEGVDDPEFGSGGLNTGAGNEFDRVPSHPVLDTTVLASARPSGRDHFSAYEQGADVAPSDSVRADLAITRTAAGGLILATSAITASGCLPLNRGDNPMSRICNNVLDRMLE